MKQFGFNSICKFYDTHKIGMILWVLVVLFFATARAQDTVSAPGNEVTTISQIRYVSRFPPKKAPVETGVFDRIAEFIFGKEQALTLIKPMSVWAKSPESFWVLDQGLGAMLKIQDKVGEIPQFYRERHASLVDICMSPNGQFYFTDSRANKIFILNPEESSLTEFETSSDLNQPTGIAYSRLNDEIWVVETALHRITVFNPEGEVIRSIGTRGEGPGQFNYPTFIWIDKAGVVYIVDSMNFRIQILNSKGKYISDFGQIGDASGFFSRPKGIATDSFGNIYVVDALFHAVQIFDKNGNLLYHFGRQGREDGEFWMPTGIFIDNENYIYVSDSYNARVQIFQLINGQVDEAKED